MKKLITSVSISLSILSLCISSLSAFDWPQNEILSDSFFSYFGQLRGGTIGTSLVFSESREVKAADDGKVLAVISEHDEDELFESTLGNAAILAHKDDLITVYANLDSQALDTLYKMNDVKSGTVFGGIGSSGWQEGEGCLEFQVLAHPQEDLDDEVRAGAEGQDRTGAILRSASSPRRPVLAYSNLTRTY